MSIVDRWLLPDGVEDVLPPQARQLEEIRRRLLDLFETWGYEYVIPPMVEFLESLLTGTGHDLDLKTFKVVDLLTGRTMGLRADITPQVARIDAHSLNRDGIVRLCYAGTVVQSLSDTMLASRTPLSVGAELFGETSSRGDLEIVSMMAQSLKSLGFSSVHVDLGNVAIFRQLIESLAVTRDEGQILFEQVQRKAVAELEESARSFGLNDMDVSLICALPGLCGDESVLAQGREIFAAFDGILECIDNLELVSNAIRARFADVVVYFDLSELRGYAYHTGIVFAAYVDGLEQVVAKGGRYDDIGQVFGRASRGATGFSINVRSLLHSAEIDVPGRQSVRAPINSGDESLWQEVQRLRGAGYIVVESAEVDGFDYELEFRDNKWCLTPLQK
jgi:ATP phosphoribosyltransferase regulatory subunit